ncbi:MULTISPECIES: hypothetical protein [unclassified Aeromonas]|uniref:hypothetical protein n=2 Tax=unclassified Aeromonas TaxID=257493 RepID=UPI0022E15D61|nr:MULTISPECIES: hypothetical protein [unclassified Aeromonas]
MSNFITRRISVTILKHGIPNLIFAIDTPRAEEIRLFTSSMIKLSGWVLYNKNPVEVVIKHSHGEDIFKCNRFRPDVLKNLNIEAVELCGFLIPITFSGSFDVGFIVNDGVAWGARIDIKPAEKIQFGKSGYLFLDNDHNKSVAQFNGQELISEKSISSWRDYFSTLNEYIDNSKAKRIFTLAPAKELVLPQYYPHKKADITPVEQFMINFHMEDILYPKDALSHAGDSTYSRQDTHWTDYGAGIVANYILDSIGTSLKEPFPFQFRIIKAKGDLGVKISKTTYQEVMKADFSSARKLKTFDNGINNRGLIQTYHNPDAVINKKIVVFGDSFSHNLVPYFVNVFSRVVYILSGASIDYDVLKHEQPDLVICEITTRFLVQAPESNYSVSHDCKRKILTLSASEQADYLHTLQTSDQKHAFYIQKTIAELDAPALPSLAG